MSSHTRILAFALTVLQLVGTAVLAEINYNDVAVVVNTNSSVSLAIGEYFKNARSIPSSNIIYVSTSPAEEIDSTEFASLRSQIENYLRTQNLVDPINYIVTTKGVPLKVNRGDTFSTMSPSSSVESELTLVLGPNSAWIGAAGRIISPYYYQSGHFSRAEYGMYLVTRLDGYSLQDVYTLIDRGGPGVRVDRRAEYVLDQDPDWNSSLPSLNNYMAAAKAILEGKNKTVHFDSTGIYETKIPDVVGYVSWGSNDHNAGAYTEYGIPHNTWAPGGIAETYVSTSGRSFEAPPSYGQSLIADLVAEGASGAKGYVYEPFSSSMALVQILFDRYTNGYNLAESYYAASRYVSWMDVVVGDPKTTIQESTAPLPVQLQYIKASFNEINRTVQVSWGTVSETNNYGFVVQRRSGSTGEFVDIAGSFTPGHGTTLAPKVYTWTDCNVPSGTVFYRLRQIDLDGTVHFTESQKVSNQSLTGVDDTSLPEHLELAQNYPNPFNPSTTIGYRLPKAGHVTITVFSEIGEEIATLVDEPQSAGAHSVTFTAGLERANSAHTLASAVYFYRIQADNKTLIKKMLLVK